ncbi:MAG: flagellar assembly protein T N-terminal domain-containing protein [Colwellia sp.]
MRIWYLLITIVLLLAWPPRVALAKWYTVEGSAQTVSISKELAREMAIENALKKALLVAGANISTTQQVSNGLLMQDQFSVRASGSVNSVEILDEIYQDDMVIVMVRADVLSKNRACYKQDLKKSMLLTKSYIVNREQAHIGEIYQLDGALTTQLQTKLLDQKEHIESRVIHKNTTQFSRLNSSAKADEIKELTMTLSDISHSQYVLYSEIHDLSLHHDRENSWQVWQGPLHQRTFNATYYLYNGVNGELLWQKNYSDDALWAFGKREVIDVNSTTFWQSEYGMMVSGVLASVKNDLESEVMCEKSEARVLNVTNKEVVLNLGKANGVKLGDEFTLVYTKNFYHPNGEHLSSHHISNYKVKVSKLTEYTAIAMSHELTGNIQINDLAVRY